MTTKTAFNLLKYLHILIKFIYATFLFEIKWMRWREYCTNKTKNYCVCLFLYHSDFIKELSLFLHVTKKRSRTIGTYMEENNDPLFYFYQESRYMKRRHLNIKWNKIIQRMFCVRIGCASTIGFCTSSWLFNNPLDSFSRVIFIHI